MTALRAGSEPHGRPALSLSCPLGGSPDGASHIDACQIGLVGGASAPIIREIERGNPALRGGRDRRLARLLADERALESAKSRRDRCESGDRHACLRDRAVPPARHERRNADDRVA